jgi:hypothetical protein
MSKRLPLATVAAAAFVAAFAACVPGQQARPVASSADIARIYHQAAQCIRDHGDPGFPDPTIDAQGHPHVPDSVQKPPDQAMQACQPILDQLPPDARPPTSNPTDVAAMQRFAQCMRAQGITDWPDPDDQGRFRLPPTLAGNIKWGPRWPQIQAAWNGPCKQYNPTGRIETAS